MLKLKYFKTIYTIVLLSLIFCVNFKTAYAFFSPSTLQLLSASLGTLGQVLVVLITAIISFGIKLKRGKIKKILLVSFFSVFLVCVGIVGWRFYNLKKLNSILFDNDWWEKFRLEYLSKFADYSDRFIDLDQINKSEYDEFKKISLFPENMLLTGTILWTDIFQLKELISTNKIGELLVDYNITKKDKLLLYCNVGWNSISSAYLLNKLGYNAYWTRLNQLKTKDYVEFYHFPLNGKELPIIVPLKKDEEDKNYILFMFHKIEDDFCNPENYPSEIRNKLKKIVIWPGEQMEDEICDIPKAEFNEIFDKYSKIVCLSKIDCILTQHYLVYLNLTNEFKRVFFIE